MTNSLSIVVHAFASRVLMSFLVDETLFIDYIFYSVSSDDCIFLTAPQQRGKTLSPTNKCLRYDTKLHLTEVSHSGALGNMVYNFITITPPVHLDLN